MNGICAIALSLLVTGPSTGDAELAIDLGRGSELKSFPLSDGHSVFFVGEADSVRKLRSQLRGSGRSVVSTLPGDAALLRYRSPDRVNRITRRGRRLLLAHQTLDERIVEHLARPMPSPLPSRFTAEAFRRSEKLIARGNWRRAERVLGRLQKKPELREFSEARQADLQVIKGDPIAACATYERLQQSNPKSVPGLLASLRSHAIRCPSSSFEPDRFQTLLLRILRLEGEMAKLLWTEAMWTLAVATDLDDVDTVLDLTNDYRTDSDFPMPGVAALRREALAALFYRSQESSALAERYMKHRAEVARHPEGHHLQLLAADALMEVSLTDTAIPLLESLSAFESADPLWQASMGSARAMQLLIRAYGLAGWPALARETSEKYASLFGENPIPQRRRAANYATPIAADLNQLESRITVLERVVRSGGLP